MSKPLSLTHQCHAKFAVALAAALSALVLAPKAGAQLLGAPGTLTIGVENFTGYDVTTVKFDDRANAAVTDTTTQFSLFLKTGARVGVHYFVVPQVSIGGSLGYESFSGSVSQPDANGNFSVDKRTDSAFLLHLKVGYLLPLSNTAGFWFRAGPGVHRSSVHPTGVGPEVVTETFWTVGLDAFFVYAPVSVVGFFVGPSGDLSFVGRHSEENFGPANPDFSHSGSYRHLGLDLGIMAMF